MSFFRKILFGNTNKNSRSADLGILILRLTFGLTIALIHGFGKFPPSEKFIDGVTNLGFPLPVLFAWCATLAEFLGGLFIATGLMTRPAAFFLAFTMGVAVFGVHSADPFKIKELAFLYLSAALSLMFLGGGGLSLDRFLNRKSKN